MTNNSLKYAVGVDLGGTFVKAAEISEEGEIISQESLPIGGEASKNVILDTIEKIIRMIINVALEKKIDV